jgi:NADPH:quinone reductase-like Zn-dependent oxidoreductase
MKAIRIHQSGDASTLMLEEVPRLSITDDQLLIRNSIPFVGLLETTHIN